jgi:hypothetical protein
MRILKNALEVALFTWMNQFLLLNQNLISFKKYHIKLWLNVEKFQHI